MSPNEKFTQEHRAAVVALREGGASLDAAAATSGHAKSTVQRFEKLVSPTQRELAKELLAAECEAVAKLYIKRLGLETVVEKATARDAAVVVGIMVDKATKLRGEDKPNSLDQPLTLADYMLSLLARSSAPREAER